MGQKKVRAADRRFVSSRSAPGALRDDSKGWIERGKGREFSRPPVPPRFPGVQLNSLPTYRRALSERLEQASCVAD